MLQRSEPSFFEDFKPDEGNFLNDTLDGLYAKPKSIPPKYLYDKRGAELFEDICSVEEYYITRIEMALMRQISSELRILAGPGARLVEFGMGDGEKARLLLSMFDKPQGFVGIDISGEQLRRQIHHMARDLPELEIGGICADFFRLDKIPENKNAESQNSKNQDRGRDIGFFPGSTIGNFLPQEQKKLLSAMRQTLGAHGSLIIGVDLKKDARIIHAAYDDSQGITAAFSLNLLTRIKRELKGKLEVEGFKHEAFYNEQDGRIEIYLHSLCEQTIHIGDHHFSIHKGEPIHIEKSYKFTPEQFQQLAQDAGWKPRKFWQDEKLFFSIHWLDVA